MIRISLQSLLSLSFVALLAGCGVEGEPERPPAKEKPQASMSAGVSLSGSASVGIVGGSR